MREETLHRLEVCQGSYRLKVQNTLVDGAKFLIQTAMTIRPSNRFGLNPPLDNPFALLFIVLGVAYAVFCALFLAVGLLAWVGITYLDIPEWVGNGALYTAFFAWPVITFGLIWWMNKSEEESSGRVDQCLKQVTFDGPALLG